MPVYQYICPSGHIHEEYQSIKAFDKNRVVKCLECQQDMESYIGEPILVTCDNGPTTIGQLAERNFKNLGKIKGEEKAREIKNRKKAVQDELCRSSGVDPATVPDYKKMKKLASLNEDQKRRYIETGKLPPDKPRSNNW
jgi:hypothetical protein